MAELIIVDEVAFIGTKMLQEGILPVGMSEHVATLLATTPGESVSWFMQSIKIIDAETGKPLIPLLQSFKPCDAHSKTATQWTCTCNIDKRANWKSPSRERKWKQFWQGNIEVFEAERRGVVVDSAGVIFNAECVHRLATRDKFHIRHPPRYIYIGIDPAEGGKDHFAMTAMAFCEGVWVVS